MSIPFTTAGAFARALTWRLVAVGALAVTMSAIATSPASAGSHERILTKGGVVWFDHTGDYIAALDRRKDGHAVRAYLNWAEQQGGETVLREEEVTDDRGFTPGPADPDRAVYRKLFIPEGTTVTLTMCYAEGDINRRCSNGQRATASIASAGESENISTDRGAVWFNHDGDRLYAIDTKVDGMGVQAFLTWNRTHSASVVDRGAHGPPKPKNLNIAEGTIVDLQLCYFRDSGLVKCSESQSAIA
jgi:hypothetical protein